MGMFLLFSQLGGQVPPPVTKFYLKTEDGFHFKTEDGFDIILENSITTDEEI